VASLRDALSAAQREAATCAAAAADLRSRSAALEREKELAALEVKEAKQKTSRLSVLQTEQERLTRSIADRDASLASLSTQHLKTQSELSEALLQVRFSFHLKHFFRTQSVYMHTENVSNSDISLNAGGVPFTGRGEAVRRASAAQRGALTVT